MSRVALCAIVKNEARDIAEWLAYHTLLGFDTIIVFDNGSTDGTDAILEQAGKTLPVQVRPWPRRDPRYQTAAYEEACRELAGQFDWVAFFDADEFLVLHRDPDIKALARRFRRLPPRLPSTGRSSAPTGTRTTMPAWRPIASPGAALTGSPPTSTSSRSSARRRSSPAGTRTSSMSTARIATRRAAPWSGSASSTARICKAASRPARRTSPAASSTIITHARARIGWRRCGAAIRRASCRAGPATSTCTTATRSRTARLPFGPLRCAS